MGGRGTAELPQGTDRKRTQKHDKEGKQMMEGLTHRQREFRFDRVGNRTPLKVFILFFKLTYNKIDCFVCVQIYEF